MKVTAADFPSRQEMEMSLFINTTIDHGLRLKMQELGYADEIGLGGPRERLEWAGTS